MNRKGFEKSIGVIITIVVLLVVALAVITIVLDRVDDTQEDINPIEDDATCNIWKKSACGDDNTGIKTHPTIAGCEVDCSI